MTTHNKQKTFKGGIHPPDMKMTCDRKITQGPVSSEISIILSQHIGTACKPIVSKGDTVEAGQKIGDSEAFVSAPVHSPVNGKVKEIALRSHPVLGKTEAIVITPENENTPKMPDPGFNQDINEDNYTQEDICTAIRNCGVVGMGGAGFPTRVKVEVNPRMDKHTMIVNGCECEPCICCDYRIMLEWTKQIIAGIKLVRKASNCSRVFIGIEDNKPKAIELMNLALSECANTENISVVTLKTKYPQGGERQLISSILGKNVPTGGIPPMIGVLVINVATLAAVTEAVVGAIPLTHRTVTVSGTAVANPGNFYTPIGTTVNELIEFAGGIVQKSAKVIMGGPMMGFSVADLDTPITKTCGSIIVLTKEQIGSAKFKQHRTPCIKCGRCLQVCPENLNPTVISHAVKHNLFDTAKKYYINACIECGSCSYVCPANIEVSGYIKTGKIHLARLEKKIK